MYRTVRMLFHLESGPKARLLGHSHFLLGWIFLFYPMLKSKRDIKPLVSHGNPVHHSRIPHHYGT